MGWPHASLLRTFLRHGEDTCRKASSRGWSSDPWHEFILRSRNYFGARAAATVLSSLPGAVPPSDVRQMDWRISPRPAFPENGPYGSLFSRHLASSAAGPTGTDGEGDTASSEDSVQPQKAVSGKAKVLRKPRAKVPRKVKTEGSGGDAAGVSGKEAGAGGTTNGSAEKAVGGSGVSLEAVALPVKKKRATRKKVKEGGPPVMDAEKVWEELESRTKANLRVLLTGAERDKVSKVFGDFTERGWAADQALALYINSKIFPAAASQFRKYVLKALTPGLKDALLSLGPSLDAERFLFPLFAEYCFSAFAAEIKSYRGLVESADMTKPHTWYPLARTLRRRIIYHAGPTNSGKTYAALSHFRLADSGLYCGPLRLLAMEVYDSVNADGVYCNLVTGQERKEVPFAAHTACTVEMANLTRSYKVAVIDEIQMIADEYRGWAWTRALLGLQAEEVHVCGDPSALPLLRSLCAASGDELHEFRYDRLKPLRVDAHSLEGNFGKVKAGDCIVAFSRREIFEIKRQVERFTPHRCCVVYGALPPETRRQQAQLFNSAGSGYAVLVASDAVGMGLNLNIARIIFYALHKFNGESKALIPSPMVKQIAGRAGRRGSDFAEGVTTSFHHKDILHLESGLAQAVEPLGSAGLFPVFDQFELFATQIPDCTFLQLLERFVETCRTDGSFFLCKTDALKKVAKALDRVEGLSLEDRFKFCFAPTNLRDPRSVDALRQFAEKYVRQEGVRLVLQAEEGGGWVADDQKLMELEAKHQVVSMYMWLSQHFDKDCFPDAERAGAIAKQIADILATSLSSKSGSVPTRVSVEETSRGSWKWNRLSKGGEDSTVTTRIAPQSLPSFKREARPQLRT